MAQMLTMAKTGVKWTSLHLSKTNSGERENLLFPKCIKNNSHETPILILNSAKTHSSQKRMYSYAPYFMRICRF